MKQLTGIIPPIVTPFNRSGEIDEAALREHIRFMLDKGVDGLCAGGSTGEGYTLNLSELARLVEVTADEVAGRVPIVAGIITNSTYDLIARAKAVREFGVTALQVTPTFYTHNPGEDGTVGHFKALTEQVEIPVILYNVIRWNMLSADFLLRIMSEVPGILGVKQSGGEIKILADLVIRAPKGKLIYSGQDALLYPSFIMGAHGAIAANPTAAPAACVALWNAVKAGDHETALGLHQRLLLLWNIIGGGNCPACVKYCLSLQDCPAGLPRLPMPVASPQQQAAIKPILVELLDYVAAKQAKATH
jgi:4-hydroxy-tetrahydrodipicolinate synthase